MRARHHACTSPATTLQPPARPPMPAPEPNGVLDACQRWLQRAVIGLNLCPFARAPHVGGRIRWVLSEATDSDALIEELLRELEHLRAHDIADVETTLLVIHQWLQKMLYKTLTRQTETLQLFLLHRLLHLE